MSKPDVLGATRARFEAGLKTRALALGSSNTARFLPGMHWFDVFDLAVANTFGRIHRCVNCGVGGDTSRGLLARFEEDAAFYQPHLAFITIGFNDANPDRKISAAEFRENILRLRERLGHAGCAVVFQTYYAVQTENLSVDHSDGFRVNMDTVRAAAAETGAGLIDHLKRWEALRVAHPETYLTLMHDNCHVNFRGNMVMGIDIIRHFGLGITASPEPDFYREALEIQGLMDKLTG
jgi:lysophospholipase L1-like esterase